MEKQNEIWTTAFINGGVYEVSNMGRIRSLSNMGDFKYFCVISHNADNYTIIRGIPLHRIVAQLYVDGAKMGLVVNHKNGIKTDNRASNLEWVTQSENIKHADKTGLRLNKLQEKLDFERMVDRAVFDLFNKGTDTIDISKMLMITVGKVTKSMKKQGLWGERSAFYF
jgi:hypothetical protein